MRSGSMALIVLAFAASCASGPARVPPERWPAAERGSVLGAIEGARDELERGRPAVALALVEGVLATAPGAIGAHRLRQDILLTRGRRGLVLAEAERRLATDGDTAAALYLRGRLAAGAEQRAWFERAVAADPGCYWGWFGLAHALRDDDPQQSIAIYRRLRERPDGEPFASVALAAALRGAGDDDGATAVFDELVAAGGRYEGLGHFGRADSLLAADRDRSALDALVRGLALRPHDPAAVRLCRELVDRGIARDRVRRLLDVLQQEPGRLRAFVDAGGGALAVELFERLGRDPAALGPAAALPADSQRVLRRMRLARGDVAGFLGELRAALPRPLLDDESNQVRGVWLELLDGPGARAGNPLAAGAAGLGLARALARVGLLDEAATTVNLVLHRARDLDEPAVAELLAQQADARREAAFEDGIRRLLYRDYANAAPPGLDALLDEIRVLSQRILGRDVVGSPHRFRVPLVGELVDPFGPGLPAHLARYNKHLVLGQRAGQPVEGMLLTRVAVRYLEPDPGQPLPARCWQVVGEDRQIDTVNGLLGGGDLAGIALLNHYVIDLDAVRDWAANQRERRRIIAADGGALLDDPLPEGVDPLDPVDAHWRLVAGSQVPDEELEAAVLDMICRHERGHLVDSFHYLPPEANLWRVLGLVVGHGFDALAIEGEMEGRAELAALAFSPHTALVLAHIASFCLGERAGSPHAVGFRGLAARINGVLAARSEHATAARVSRWHTVPLPVFRQIARALLAAGG